MITKSDWNADAREQQAEDDEAVEREIHEDLVDPVELLDAIVSMPYEEFISALITIEHKFRCGVKWISPEEIALCEVMREMVKRNVMERRGRADARRMTASLMEAHDITMSMLSKGD